MPIIDFFPEPNIVTQNQLMLMQSRFTELTGIVVYEIAARSKITFVAGQRMIEADIENKRDTTTTTLEGPSGGVLIKAYNKETPDVKILRLVRKT